MMTLFLFLGADYDTVAMAYHKSLTHYKRVHGFANNLELMIQDDLNYAKLSPIERSSLDASGSSDGE